MTSATPPDDRREAWFVADFHPRFGAYLARQHESGYDAVAARARFLIWLATHTDAGDALAGYLAEAGRIPRLTADEEAELATLIQAGRRAEEQLTDGGDALTGQARAELEQVAQDGTRAGDHLLEAHLWLVVSIAERFADRGVPLPDLVREGNLGLVRAVQRYDHAKGYRFATFATWWIRRAMTRALPGGSRATPIPEPGTAVTDQLALTERLMLQDLGREPTPEELAAELDPSPSATSWSPRGPDQDRDP